MQRTTLSALLIGIGLAVAVGGQTKPPLPPAAYGAQPVFTADSHWVAYSIGVPEAQQDKLRKDKKPIHNKLGLLDLSSGRTTTVDEIESFAFNAGGSHLAMRHYAPEKKDAPPADGAAAPDADEAPQG